MCIRDSNVVTEHFSDIQLIDTAPDNIRRRITETADRVDNLTVDRRIFKSGEHKLSTHTYHRMEQFEDELPRDVYKRQGGTDCLCADVYKGLHSDV